MASADSVEDAMLATLPVAPGDVVVMGTDGLFDNMADEELVDSVERMMLTGGWKGGGCRRAPWASRGHQRAARGACTLSAVRPAALRNTALACRMLAGRAASSPTDQPPTRHPCPSIRPQGRRQAPWRRRSRSARLTTLSTSAA